MSTSSAAKIKGWLPIVVVAVSVIVAFTQLRSSSEAHILAPSHKGTADRMKALEDTTFSHGYSLTSVANQVTRINTEQTKMAEATADVRIIQNDLSHVVKDVAENQQTLKAHTDILQKILIATEK